MTVDIAGGEGERRPGHGTGPPRVRNCAYGWNSTPWARWISPPQLIVFVCRRM